MEILRLEIMPANPWLASPRLPYVEIDLQNRKIKFLYNIYFLRDGRIAYGIRLAPDEAYFEKGIGLPRIVASSALNTYFKE